MTSKESDGPQEDQGLAAFDRLCSLVGTWEDVDKPVTVEYRKTANDSVLVETWTWPRTNTESLTLYHLDAGKLIATHYCPVGNQPRLRLVSSSGRDTLAFEFVSATNLPDPAVDHCIAFWIRFDDDQTITRSETYEANGAPGTQQSTYKRRHLRDRRNGPTQRNVRTHRWQRSCSLYAEWSREGAVFSRRTSPLLPL